MNKGHGFQIGMMYLYCAAALWDAIHDASPWALLFAFITWSCAYGETLWSIKERGK